MILPLSNLSCRTLITAVNAGIDPGPPYNLGKLYGKTAAFNNLAVPSAGNLLHLGAFVGATLQVATCYSVRLLDARYAGPVVSVRRRADGATSDFYANASQSGGELWSTGQGTGTSLTTWLGPGSTAHVVKWYDQSGAGNHAVNSTTGPSQPRLVRHCGYWVVRWTPAQSTVLNMTTPIQPVTVVAHYLDDNLSGSGTFVTTAYDYGLRLYTGALSNGNVGDWYACAGGTKLAYINDVAVTNNASANAWWTSLAVSSSSPTWVNSQTGGASASFTRIGTDGYSPTARGMGGYMTELYFHKAPLLAAEMSTFLSRIPVRPTIASFPPDVMTANTTTFAASPSMGQAWTSDGGAYTASASSSYGAVDYIYLPWIAFHPGGGYVGGWTEAAFTYNGTGSAYTGALTTAGYAGEYLQLQCPRPFYITGFSITAGLTSRAPQDFVLLGSANGGNTWTLLDQRTGVVNYVANVPNAFVPNQSVLAAFSVLRLVPSRTSGDSWLSIYGLKFYGHPQADVAPSYVGLTLSLDAAAYAVGTTTWNDQSGIGYNFPLMNATSPYGYVANPSSYPYFSFAPGGTSYAYRNTGGDLPVGAYNTAVVITKVSSSASDWRTLFRASQNGQNHQVLISTSNSLGMYDNDSATNFIGCDTPVTIGIGAMANACTQMNMMVWKLNTVAPYYTFYMNPSASPLVPTGAIATNSHAKINTGISFLGACGPTQYWGDVGVVLWYNRTLSDAEIVALYAAYQPRFGLP